jgi:hypothetical protein
MCNLYSIITGQDAVRRLFGATIDNTGNLPPPGVFPDYEAPVVRQRRWWPRTDQNALGHAAAKVWRPADTQRHSVPLKLCGR